VVTWSTGTGNTANVVFTWQPPDDPPPAPVPARPAPRPPGLPPVLAAVRAPDGVWEVPALAPAWISRR